MGCAITMAMNELNKEIAHKLSALNSLKWLPPHLRKEREFLLRVLKEINK